MDSQRLPLQLLLLLLTVTHELDAYSGTTVTPWNANFSLQPASNKSTLDHKDKNQENVTVAFPYYAYAYEEYAALCWSIFVHQMDNVSNTKWCHWRAIRRPYKNLRFCLEKSAEDLNYSYPNALAEEYTFFSHRMFFLNCTSEQQVLRDPPENVLLTLILTPICLIPFLVTLVVWKSKGRQGKGSRQGGVWRSRAYPLAFSSLAAFSICAVLFEIHSGHPVYFKQDHMEEGGDARTEVLWQDLIC